MGFVWWNNVAIAYPCLQQDHCWLVGLWCEVGGRREGTYTSLFSSVFLWSYAISSPWCFKIRILGGHGNLVNEWYGKEETDHVITMMLYGKDTLFMEVMTILSSGETKKMIFWWEYGFIDGYYMIHKRNVNRRKRKLRVFRQDFITGKVTSWGGASINASDWRKGMGKMQRQIYQSLSWILSQAKCSRFTQ